MKTALGKRHRISLPRKLIIDFLYFSRSVPLVSVDKRVCLAAIAEARARHPQRPPWSAIFAKAFALVAAEMPVLRQAYISAPFPYIFEYNENVVFITHELPVGSELGVLPVRIRSPDELPLTHFRYKIDEMSDADMWQRGAYRTLALVSHLPLLLRRLLWWIALNVPRVRKRFLGTFCVTSVGALGVTPTTAIAPTTSLLTYGPLDQDGWIVIRLVFDHRVYDGATAARALARLEELLLGPIRDELTMDRTDQP